MTDGRWTFVGTSPSTRWLRAVAPALLDSRRVLLSKPPKVSLVFAAGTTEDEVRGVVEQARAGGAYDVTVARVGWPPAPEGEPVHRDLPDDGLSRDAP